MILKNNRILFSTDGTLIYSPGGGPSIAVFTATHRDNAHIVCKIQNGQCPIMGTPYSTLLAINGRKGGIGHGTPYSSLFAILVSGNGVLSSRVHTHTDEECDGGTQ